MKKIGSYEAKTNLPRLLDKVANGEEYAITKHGVPVAWLIPVPESKHKNSRSAIAKIHEFRKLHKLGNLSLKELISKGRK